MKNKFFVGLLITSILTIGNIIPSLAATEASVVVLNIGNPTMFVNGIEKKIDPDNEVSPVLVNDYTMIPIRAIIESMGGEVLWEEDEQKVTVSYDNKVVELWLDNNSAVVDGIEMYVNVAPMTINGRTMLPLRFVSESLGLCVNWEESTEAISVTPDNDYVAIVGGVKVQKAEYYMYLNTAESEVTDYLSKRNVITTAEDYNILNYQIDGTNAGDVAKGKALQYAIQHQLFLNEANEKNVSLTEEELKEIDNSISLMVQQEGGLTAIEQKLMDYNHVNLSEYTKFVKENKLVNKYLQNVLKQIVISEDDIANKYMASKQSYEKVTVQHILISTREQDGTTFSAEKQEQARIKAEEVLKKVKSGEDFATLAKQYSEDPGSKDSGGKYTFTRGKMIKEFEDWSFQAKDGDMEIVKSAYGYHVMKYIGRNTEAEIKSIIRNELTYEALNEYVDNTLLNYRSVTVKNQSVFDTITLN